MASQAEVDLVISTAGALPDLERDLGRIITTAESGAPAVDVGASIAVQGTIAQLSTQLDRVINSVDATDPTIDVQAAIDTRDSLNALRTDVDRIVRAASVGADPVALQAAIDPIRSLRRINTSLDTVVRRAEAAAPSIELNVETDRFGLRTVSSGLIDVARRAGSAALSLGRLGASAGIAGVAVGGLVPVVAGLVTSLTNVAPAAAVAVSGILAVQLAAATVQIAMIGVEDAITDAFDPDVKPEDLAKSLERLAPEARKFVLELRSMRGELSRVQQGVQNRFFRDFDETLSSLADKALPDLRRGLNATANVLNEMARGAANAAGRLADDGTLGTAIDGATKGLENLSQVPAQVVTALGQLAAASAPALDRLTRRIDTEATKIAERLAEAFESGALEDEIDQAISALGQLLDIGGNVIGGLGNIFSGLTEDGGGLFDILEKITQAFEDLTASQEFQTILEELALTADELVAQVLPLLQEAFIQLAPVIRELAPVVREFIKEVGPELIPILKELGPILVDLALIMKEQLPLAIDLAKAALDAIQIALQGLRFLLDEIILPISREVSAFYESDMVDAFQAYANGVDDAIGIVGRKLFEMGGAFSDSFGAASRVLSDFSENLRDTVVRGIQSFVVDAVERFRGFGRDLLEFFRGLDSDLYSAGVDAITGFANGLLSGVNRILGIARGIAERIESTIRGALETGSPSKVMIRVGQDTGEGLAVGLRRMIPEIEDTVNGIAGLVAPSFALPNGQSLPLSPLSVGPPNVSVFIGNEQLDTRTDARIQASNRARDRVLSQGVRR